MKSTQSLHLIKRTAKLTIMAGAAMLLLSSCSFFAKRESDKEFSVRNAVPDDKQLIVYTSHKEEVYLPIIREFENRTGIWVEIHTGGTAEILSQVREVSVSGGCDVMFGGGIETYKAQKDLFTPYETNEKEILDENYLDSENYYTPFTELPLVFVYNKKLVSYSEIPRTFKAMMDEKWKGKIAFADPNKSGTSYTIISTMQQVLGSDPRSFVPELSDQIDGNILSSSGDVIPKVADGSCLVGITLEETARKAMEEGYDISMLYPEDGTSAVPDGCAIVKNAPHGYNAGKFIDFIVGYDTQKYAAGSFFRRSVRKDLIEEDKKKIKIIDFDIEQSAAQESEVLSLWNDLNDREGD